MTHAEIHPGDSYEDCSFHPVLCTYIDDGDEIGGISLIDASAPRACSLSGCAVVKLSIEDVVAARADWPAYLVREGKKIEAIKAYRENTGEELKEAHDASSGSVETFHRCARPPSGQVAEPSRACRPESRSAAGADSHLAPAPEFRRPAG